MAWWDEVGSALNPIASLLARSSQGRAGAKIGARVLDEPNISAALQGMVSGAVPGASTVNRRSSGAMTKGRATGAPRGKKFSSGNLGMGAPTAQANPLDQLLAMMQGMVGTTGPTYEPDYEDLMDQIRRQVDPVYDARRAAIDRLSERASERVGTGRQDVEAMYNALAQDYGTQAQQAEEMLGESQQEAQQIAGQLKKNIQGSYSRIAEEQAERLQALGQEHVMPDILAEQGADQAFQESQAAQTGAAAESFYNQLGAADQAYYQQGAPLARLEGTNRSADLLAQLEDYLAQAEAGQMELEGQRTSDITSAFNQLAQQAQQFAQQQSAGQGQQQWGRMMDLFGIMAPMYGPQEQGEPVGTTSQIIASQLGLADQENTQFQRALSEIIDTSPALLYGQVTNPDTGESVKTTPAQISSIVRNYARQKGLSGRVENALMLWAESMSG